MLNVGDKVKILEEGHNLATVFKGDILEVTEVDDFGFETEAPRLTIKATWMFNFEDEGTGWEKYEGEK